MSANNHEDVPIRQRWVDFSTGNFQIRFRSHHDTYVCAEPNARMVGNRPKPDIWELFRVHSQGNGLFALETHHRKYVCATERGLVGDRDAIGPWEMFRAVPAPEPWRGRVALLTHLGTYITVDTWGRVWTDRRELREWETFRIYVTAPETLPPIAWWLNDLQLQHCFISLIRHGIDTPRKLTDTTSQQLHDQMGIGAQEDRERILANLEPFAHRQLTVYVKERVWVHDTDKLLGGTLGKIGKYCGRLGDDCASHTILLMVAVKNLVTDVRLVNMQETPEWFTLLGDSTPNRTMIGLDDWKQLPETPVVDDTLHETRIFSLEKAVQHLDEAFGPPMVLGEDKRPSGMDTLFGAMIWSIRAPNDFPGDESKIDEAKQNLSRILMGLNAHLAQSGGPYLNGEMLSFADLRILPMLYQYEIVTAPLNEYVYSSLRAYLNHVYQQGWWQAYLCSPKAVIDGWRSRNIMR